MLIHHQALTPVALQDDEIAALANAQQAVTKQKIVVNPPASSAPVSTLRTVLTTGLRPQQTLVQPVMRPPGVKVVTSSAQPATIIPDPADPGLDENLLNILAADGEEDDPMTSPGVNTLVSGLTSSNTALVLPNTVFSSKPMSSVEDVGVFLQSSGKSRLADTGHSTPVVTSKPVILTGSGGSQFALPRSSGSGAVRTLAHSVTTSSQTLRSLLSSTLENLPVSQTMILTPLKKTVNTSNSYQTLVQPPPATDTVTLTLDDIMTITPATGHRTLVQTAGSVSSVTASDRESDLTSPGSVRSEATDTVNGRSDDMGDLSHQSDKLSCQFPGCARTFDRPNLLKRHQKIHSGECRFDEIMTVKFSVL